MSHPRGIFGGKWSPLGLSGFCIHYSDHKEPRVRLQLAPFENGIALLSRTDLYSGEAKIRG